MAIRLAPEVDAAIARFQAELRPLGGDISWPAAANFHLTLRFLGNRVAPGIIENVIFSLRPIAAATAAMTLRARGAGAFPSLNRPRVIWVGLADEVLAQAAAAKVEAVCVRCGLEPEKRRFAPHLTIGRVRSPARDPRMREALEAAAERDFGGSTVASITVYRSRLSPRGATYEALATLPLLGRPAGGRLVPKPDIASRRGDLTLAPFLEKGKGQTERFARPLPLEEGAWNLVPPRRQSAPQCAARPCGAGSSVFDYVYYIANAAASPAAISNSRFGECLSNSNIDVKRSKTKDSRKPQQLMKYRSGADAARSIRTNPEE